MCEHLELPHLEHILGLFTLICRIFRLEDRINWFKKNDIVFLQIFCLYAFGYKLN